MTQPVQETRSPGTGFLVTLVAVAFVMNTVGRGVPETFAVFLLPVQNLLGATRPEMTATYSIYMLAYGFSAPFAGQLIDRFGARVTYGVGLACFGIGYVLAGSVTAIWQYYVCVGLLGGLGAAALGMVVASSLLTRWFTTRVGSIISLPYAAVGAGMLVFPPLTQLLLETYGPRTAHRLVGAIALVLLPLVMILPLKRMALGSDEWRRQRSLAAEAVTGPWTVWTSIRTSAFWGLFSAYFWTSVAAYSVLPQSVAYLIEQGFDPLLAASAFGMTGALSACGIVAVGWLSDRFGRLPTVTLSYLMSIFGTLSLIFVAVTPSLALLYSFVILFGLVQGARGPIIVALVSVLFRGGAIGAIFGTLSVAMGLGAGAGSLVSGYLHQVTDTYYASFALGILGSTLGLLSFWLVPAIRHERPPAQSLARSAQAQASGP